jgi:hypothetical protein
VPNTQLSIIIVKQIQYEHYRLSLQLGQSHTTHPTSPRHSYKDSSHQDSSVITNFTTLAKHPKRASTKESLPLPYHKTSHILATRLPQTQPKIRPPQLFPYNHLKETQPTHVDRIGSLRDLASLHSSLP